MKKTDKESCVLTTMVKTNLDLLSRHISVLQVLQEKQPIGISEISEKVNHPQHKVRYSLKILEQEGLIEPSAGGAVTTENADEIIKRIKNTIIDVNTSYNDLLKRLE